MERLSIGICEMGGVAAKLRYVAKEDGSVESFMRDAGITNNAGIEAPVKCSAN